MRRALAIAFVLAGCQDGLDAPFDPAALDRPYFDCNVQPVITKYCAALACHGDSDRYFHVYARNRLRDATDESTRNAFMRPQEREHNYDAARAMVNVDDPMHSQLLLKPLEEAAGGYFHVGANLYRGGNVFTATDDPDYTIISQWIGGATDDPACTEPGSNL